MSPKEINAAVARATALWPFRRMVRNAWTVELNDLLRQRAAINLRISQLRAKLDGTE